VLAWLTWRETDRWDVTIAPSTPIVRAHAALQEDRALSQEDVAEFTLVREAHASGPLDTNALAADAELVRHELGTIDARLERVVAQQYIKFAVLRRDVTYEMCGTKGTLVLSGRHLAGATTPEAVRPIRRRLWAWLIAVPLVAAIAVVLRAISTGSTEYFETTRSATAGFGIIATLCAAPAMGTLLRSWRGGVRFHRIKLLPKLGMAAVALSLGAVPVIGLAARPSASDVDAALKSSNPARARVVIDAIKEGNGNSSDVLDLDDRVALAEASRVQGDARLAILDRVANRHGRSSADAASAALSERIAQAQHMIDNKNAAGALAALDRWFPGKTGVQPVVAEERARAHDVLSVACVTDVCRVGEAYDANVATPTSQRAAALATYRDAVNTQLDPKHVDAKDTVERLKQIGRLADTATGTLKRIPQDPDLTARANTGIQWADAERLKVPLLRNALPVATEILGTTSTSGKNLAIAHLDGTDAYLTLDDSGRCTGIYAVGSGSARVQQSQRWPAQRILSQAVGKPATIHDPTPASTSVSRWYEAGFPVIARWREGALIELRIGDATP
jgi:hypothetical protein